MENVDQSKGNEKPEPPKPVWPWILSLYLLSVLISYAMSSAETFRLASAMGAGLAPILFALVGAGIATVISRLSRKRNLSREHFLWLFVAVYLVSLVSMLFGAR